MADRSPLPFRVLRLGLQAASRASSSVVDRVMRSTEPGGAAFVRADGVRARPPPPGTPVRVGVDGRWVEVEFGSTVLDVARTHQLDLRSYCGGNCSCGTCRIHVVRGGGNLSRAADNETFTLGMEAAHRGDRLACQTRILGEVELQFPRW